MHLTQFDNLQTNIEDCLLSENSIRCYWFRMHHKGESYAPFLVRLHKYHNFNTRLNIFLSQL